MYHYLRNTWSNTIINTIDNYYREELLNELDKKQKENDVLVKQLKLVTSSQFTAWALIMFMVGMFECKRKRLLECWTLRKYKWWAGFFVMANLPGPHQTLVVRLVLSHLNRLRAGMEQLAVQLMAIQMGNGVATHDAYVSRSSSLVDGWSRS